MWTKEHEILTPLSAKTSVHHSLTPKAGDDETSLLPFFYVLEDGLLFSIFASVHINNVVANYVHYVIMQNQNKAATVWSFFLFFTTLVWKFSLKIDRVISLTILETTRGFTQTG